MLRKIVLLRVAWVTICVLVLVACVSTSNTTTCRDNDIVLILLMIALGFPSAYLVVCLYSAFAALHGSTLPVGRIEMSVLWVGFFGFGYFQWFVLAPWIFRRVRRVWRLKQPSISST